MADRAARRPREIATDVFLLGPHGRTQTNVYLVRSETSLVLIDAGWAGDAERIRVAARSVSGTAARPSAIVLTHCHPDHDGSALELARGWDCPVYVHAAELAIARGDFSTMWRYAGPLDRYVILPALSAMGRRRRDAMLARSSLGDVVEVLGPNGRVPHLVGWRWILTPGHSPGHVSYQRASDGVLVSGDALLTLRVNSIAGVILGRAGLSGPPLYTTWNRDRAGRSMRTLAQLQPRVLAPGHGPPLMGSDTPQRLAAFAAR